MFINKATDQSNLDMSDGRDLNYYLEMTKDYKPDFTFSIKQIEGYNVIGSGSLESTASPYILR